MNAQDKKPRPNAAKLRKILLYFYVACASVLALDVILHRHYEHPWEWVPFFYCVFGFVACVILVVIAKLMRKPLMRSETYYDAD